MEQKLNIAKILKNKPRGTKLYSMIHGKCSFEAVTDEIFKINFCTSKFGLTQSGECTLIKFGNMYDGGECIIFPSKEMRDWSKFSWKKGDILISNDGGTEVIFDKWYDDTYTSFYCKHYLNSEDKNKIVYYEEFLCTTARYSLEDTVQTYIKTIEERLGGKLNRETLEIEKQQEFKDGDVVFVRLKRFSFIEIFNYFKDDYLYDHASLSTTLQTIDICGKYPISKDEIVEIRLATDSEKQQLFDALAKEGKAWDVEKKKIVGLPPKFDGLKPFDKVLVRDDKEDLWFANIFSYRHRDMYYCLGECYRYCIPYEGNEKLLGTMDDVS